MKISTREGTEASAPWDKYRARYNARPETFDAYVDVWTRVPEAQESFAGWVGFAQAANAEPRCVASNPERVHVAEGIMRKGGYELGSATDRGGRRWQPAPRRRPRLGTLRLFGRKISV